MAAVADTKRIRIERIRTDGTQTRKFNPIVASEYAAAMSAGAKFPAVVVFYDGTDYWMSCGHHRLEASKIVEAKTIECDVRAGGQFDALCHAFQDNDTHGLRVTNEDKRLRTRLALERSECDGWSDRRIAELVGVSPPTVAAVRVELKKFYSSIPLNGTPHVKSCPNCGGQEFTDDGDCARCYEPCGEANEAEALCDDADDAEDEQDDEPEVRVGIDGKKRKVPVKKKPEPKPFDSSANCMAVFDYLRSLAAKWPMQYRESLSKVLIQMSREVLTIPEAPK